MEEEKREIIPKVKQEVEKIMDDITKDGLQIANVDLLYKLIDIHKDIDNEKYWKAKKEAMTMRYRDYDSYGKYEDNRYGRDYDYPYGRRTRDSRGRYMSDGMTYHNDDPMRTLMSSYDAYVADRETYGHDKQSNKENSMITLEYMLQSVAEFMEMLKKDANSQDEMNLIRRYSKHISEM